uniref:Uncharacterized protein n=1 Tax=Cacopsylla melanoneura TaxID=428564 RepID=A0A8D8SU12_9HEMI
MSKIMIVRVNPLLVIRTLRKQLTHCQSTMRDSLTHCQSTMRYSLKSLVREAVLNQVVTHRMEVIQTLQIPRLVEQRILPLLCSHSRKTFSNHCSRTFVISDLQLLNT